MNKYDQKVMQFATGEATVYELIPKKETGYRN